jgi:hypothetical protein
MPPASRRNPAAKKTASVSALSRIDSGAVQFSLDTFEREKTYELFAADLGGQRIVMTDPAELEWQDLAELDDPVEFIDLCMSDEDKEYLLSLRLKAWQLEGLMSAYMTHYGIGNRGKGIA